MGISSEKKLLTDENALFFWKTSAILLSDKCNQEFSAIQ